MTCFDIEHLRNEHQQLLKEPDWKHNENLQIRKHNEKHTLLFIEPVDK